MSTLLGGLFALKNQDRLHRILGFTAGVILGVIAFDLLPEIFKLANEIGADPIAPMLGLVAGFMVFHIVEKLTIIHSAHEHEYDSDHAHPQLGQLSALALVAHSFFDGVGIGLAFQVSAATGAAVAIAVVAHDFADGLNTVSLMIRHRNKRGRTLLMLAMSATAPLLGALSTLFIHIPSGLLLVYLGFFAGFLLYIGAADILPQAHAKHPSKITILLTITGIILMLVVKTYSPG